MRREYHQIAPSHHLSAASCWCTYCLDSLREEWEYGRENATGRRREGAGALCVVSKREGFVVLEKEGGSKEKEPKWGGVVGWPGKTTKKDIEDGWSER